MKKFLKARQGISLLLILCGLSFVFSTDAKAQDEFEEVEVLDHPRYSLTGRFHLDADLTFLPLDAYYKPLLLEVAANYQAFDWLSLEVRGGYSLHNYDTGLRRSVDNILEQSGSASRLDSKELKLKEMHYRLSSTAFLNLLYSKSNWFNSAIVYHYWQVGAGPAYYNMKGGSQTGVDLVMRVRFFINNRYMINLRGGHTIGFSSSAPKNITFLGLGVGFAF